jgi:hypothetical protein
MHGLIREEGSFGPNPSPKDVARHLLTRMSCGKVVVVASDPVLVLSALHKQWLKLARKVQSERTNTQDATKIHELSETVSRMHNLCFTTNWPQDDFEADVYIVSIEQLLGWPPECSTLYVACHVPKESLYTVSALMPRGALVVLCPLTP